MKKLFYILFTLLLCGCSSSHTDEKDAAKADKKIDTVVARKEYVNPPLVVVTDVPQRHIIHYYPMPRDVVIIKTRPFIARPRPMFVRQHSVHVVLMNRPARIHHHYHH